MTAPCRPPDALRTGRRRLMVLALLCAGGCTAQVQTVVPAPAAQAGANTASRLTEADVGALPPMGAVYAGSVPMLGRSIPLPDGQWRVAVLGRSAFPGYPPGAEVVLLRSLPGTMTGVLSIAGNTVSRPSGSGWPLNVVCQNGDQLGRNAAILRADASAQQVGGAQDCVVVAAMRTTLWRTTGRSGSMQLVARELDRLGIVPPQTSVVVAFGETDMRYRLVERLWLNPELAGLRSDPEPRPELNAWSAGRLTADPSRAAYAARLMAWAGPWRQVVRQALDSPETIVSASVARIQ